MWLLADQRGRLILKSLLIGKRGSVADDLLIVDIWFPERLGRDVWPSGVVSIRGFAQRRALQFGAVPVPAGLGLFVREVSAFVYLVAGEFTRWPALLRLNFLFHMITISYAHLSFCFSFSLFCSTKRL